MECFLSKRRAFCSCSVEKGITLLVSILWTLFLCVLKFSAFHSFKLWCILSPCRKICDGPSLHVCLNSHPVSSLSRTLVKNYQLRRCPRYVAGLFSTYRVSSSRAIWVLLLQQPWYIMCVVVAWRCWFDVAPFPLCRTYLSLIWKVGVSMVSLTISTTT